MSDGVELATWAARLLHGTTLADKLADPGRWTDERPGTARPPPTAPGRPASLQMHRRPSRRPLPRPGAMADPRARGELLHHLANHELLALELMAVALLRFVDAEPTFRRTLAATMRDEQRHLALYLDRMAALGVEVGESPVGSFFWDCLADAPDPPAFVAGMSLVLEQANLDFSRAWRDAVAAVGDHDTAAILDQVYEDEVRHVRHGVRWLRTWSPPDVDLWTMWTSKLTFPLTPRRARGPIFDADGRERAGLDAAFVERLRATAHSKGRPPRILWFCPWVEADHARPGHTPTAAVRAVAADLAPTLGFLAGEDDVVVVPRRPSDAFLATLADAGMALPRYVESPYPTVAVARGRPISAVEPWGWSASVARRLEPLQRLAKEPASWSADTAVLARKDAGAQVLGAFLDDVADPRLDPPELAGRVCTTLDAVQRCIGDGEWVIKAPWSTAGRGRVRPRGGLSPSERGWVQRTLAEQGAVVVEPWLDRLVDFSLQATVTDAGLRVDGLVRFLVDARGGFRGAVLGRGTSDLPEDVRRFVAGEGRDPDWIPRHLEAALRRALDRAPEHRGAVGIDAFVHRTAAGLRLRPLVEINARTTFGRVALAVRKTLLDPGVSAVWWHLDAASLAHLGEPSFQAAWRRIQADHPAQGTPLRRGALATTDPASATAVWTVLVAGSEAHALLAPASV